MKAPSTRRADGAAVPAPIVSAKGRWPLIGHFPHLLRDPQGFLRGLPAQGDLVSIRLGRKPVVVVCDPALTRRFLREDRVFDKTGPLHDRIREVFGDSVGTCPHDQHRWQRRVVAPAFHHSRYPAYARTMSGQIEAAVGSWSDQQIIDIPQEILRMSAAIAGQTMFADALTPQALTQTMDDFPVVLGGLYRRTISPRLLSRIPTPATRRYDLAIGRLRHTVAQAVQARRTDRTDHGDLLSALLAAYDSADTATCRHLAGTDLVDQIVTFLIPATETTASLLSWALHLIDLHPHVRERLHAEVDAVLPPGSTAGFEHVPDLPYTGQVLTEALRLYPPGWMFSRTATTDTDLGEHTIPAGTTMLYSPYLIQRRNDAYPQGDRFDPGRWQTERPARDVFIPFGDGARKCIGDTFGTLQATLTLATIAARWDLRTLPTSRVRPARAMTLRPQGLHMRAALRISTNKSADSTAER